MTGERWIPIAALWAAAAVALGAFGAHALRETLEATDQLENWRTGVRYQVWHALAILLVCVLRRERPAGLAPWLFLVGSALFSGSIYLLALEIGSSFVWPFTPLGGTLLIAGWVVLAVRR